MQVLILSIALLVLTNALTPPDIFRAGIAAPTELPSKFANDLKILSTKSSLNTFGFPSKVGEITKASPRHCKLTLTSILTCDDRQILESNPQPNPHSCPTSSADAWGGINEPAVQNKPLPNKLAVDPWIDFEMFLQTKSAESLGKKYAKDYTEEEIVASLEAVFVSLSGGSKWLTRAKAESSLAVIESQGFEAALKKGRVEFALGWASFLLLTVGFASCIVVPTNPAAKALEQLVEIARVKGGFEYVEQMK